MYTIKFTKYVLEENNSSLMVGNIVVNINKSYISATFNEIFVSIVRKDVIEILKDNR